VTRRTCRDAASSGRVDLERTQECDKVVVLLMCEIHREAVVVEVDDRGEVLREAVVEVGRARGKATQDRSLNLPRSAHLPVISARPGSVVCTVAPVLVFRSV